MHAAVVQAAGPKTQHHHQLALTLTLTLLALSCALLISEFNFKIPSQIYKFPMMTIQCVQTFFGAITFALTLMLVFKNNASYGRWLDARRSLGMLTSTAHNLARQSVAFFPPHQAHLTAAMLRWTAASMWAVKALVRPKAPLQEELKGGCEASLHACIFEKSMSEVCLLSGRSRRTGSRLWV
jgi:predicted membrane chloride channel (bestrophin family)